MLNTTSEQEQAIAIMNTAQVTINDTQLPILELEVIPGAYSNISNLDFTWKC